MVETMTPQQQDEIIKSLKTRGFEESSFQDTPVDDFWATLTTIGSQVQEPDASKGQKFTPFTKVLYNFGDGDLEVIHSSEPYVMPILQISINHSVRKGSPMYYLGSSADKILNAGIPDDAPPEQVKGQDALIGKRQHWKKVMRPFQVKSADKDASGKNIWKEEQRLTWEIIEIAGLGSAPTTAGAPATQAAPTGRTPTQAAVADLNGKTEAEWYSSVFKLPEVKGNTVLYNAILKKQFIAPLMAAGAVAGPDAAGKYVTYPEMVKG